MSVFEVFNEMYQGTSRQSPFKPEAWSGVSSPNRIAAAHADFVRKEGSALVQRDCLVKWEGVRGPTSPTRPRLILSIMVEHTKRRFVIQGWRLRECCHHVPLSIDKVSEVVTVAEKGGYVESLDGRSSFHNQGLQPAS